MHHVVCARRSAGLAYSPCQERRRERCLFRRLMNHCVSGGQRRTQLMHGQIQRDVERRDCANHSHRLPQRHRHSALAHWNGVHRNNFATQLPGLVGANEERLQAAFGLRSSLADRLAILQADQPGEIRNVALHHVVDAHQQFRALVEGQLRHGRGARAGRRYRPVEVRHIRLLDFTNQRSVVRQAHLERLTALHPFAAYEQGTGFDIGNSCHRSTPLTQAQPIRNLDGSLQLVYRRDKSRT